MPRHRGGRDEILAHGQQMSIYDAAMKYKEDSTPLVVLAGEEYGTGSSRDWAAKGTYLLGVRAVIAKSFERNPSLEPGRNASSAVAIPRGGKPGAPRLDGKKPSTSASTTRSSLGRRSKSRRPRPTERPSASRPLCRIDTPIEVEYYRNGGNPAQSAAGFGAVVDRSLVCRSSGGRALGRPGLLPVRAFRILATA